MEKLKKKQYASELEELHKQLVDLQHSIIATGKRVAVIFEGRDAAGKGGVIKAISEPLNTRYTRTVALPKPNDREATQWYFQRYVEHLPAAGELVLFDRSWYNRAGVEHVMGFCDQAQYRRFMADCPVFEKLLADDGLILLKYWLAVDQEQQEERFAERATDPLKRWKISPVDVRAREQYAAYGTARDAMLKATHAQWAPWFVADFNDQKRGRLNLITHLLSRLPERAPPAKAPKLPRLKGKPERERLADKRFWIPEAV
ncbi:polyphosphate kinase 2 [Dokdonella ginsengisoli]|uniref:ADP/GDP-polyphosphate phosphotransferase n=1 Tax=Dokdonella ginsengisoli TaxID=363846 RepID=A0ABV9R0F9_9GAMM